MSQPTQTETTQAADIEGKQLDVLMAAYASDDAAEKDYDAIMSLAEENKITVQGVIIANKDASGEMQIKETGDHIARKGATVLGGAGLVVGLFAPPLLASTLIGAGAGALAGKFVKHRLESGIEAKLKGVLPAGSAAIIAIYDHAGADLVHAAIPNAVDTSIAQIDGSRAKELKAGLAEAGAGMKGQDKQIYIPPTISNEAQQILKSFIDAKVYAMKFPAPDAIGGWEEMYKIAEAHNKEKSEQALAASDATVTELQMGGVTVEDIRPQGWKDNGKVLVYVHGGGWCLFSARTTFADAAPMAKASGLRIVSVNYTPAPAAHFQEIQQQIVSVFDALIDAGYHMQDIAIYGDSAGGNITASTVLNLRDQGKGMPAAAVLWSPNTDLTSPDDTTVTLDSHDPILTYATLLTTGSKAYAGDVALDDPRVSPLYADLTKGFSPVMIVVGTKEMLLSSSVRFYQALEAAGYSAKLDVYEGMWHVFPQYPMPEGQVAVEKSAKFINDHLNQ